MPPGRRFDPRGGDPGHPRGAWGSDRFHPHLDLRLLSDGLRGGPGGTGVQRSGPYRGDFADRLLDTDPAAGFQGGLGKVAPGDLLKRQEAVAISTVIDKRRFQAGF